MAASDGVKPPPIPPDEAEALLALVDPLRDEVARLTEQIAPLEAQRAEVYEERADVFLRIREESGERVSFAKIADRAGVSVPAVIQQVQKAQQRRTPAEPASAET